MGISVHKHKIRMNPRGLTFILSPLKDGRTKIVHRNKEITVNCEIEEMSQRWYRWQMLNEYIQVAFSNLNADEREFLMTAITSEEWNQMIKKEEH